ncbi:MAG: hypothetical protein R3F37_00745 [Candidatus Competibacteraceae bacterium]
MIYAVLDDEPISRPPLPLRAPDPAEEIRRALRQLVNDLSPGGALTVLKTTMVHVPKQLTPCLEARPPRIGQRPVAPLIA